MNVIGYNPTLELQAIARAHRLGQTKDVYVTKYVSQMPTEATVDNRKIEIQESKNNLIQGFLKDPSPIITHKSNCNVINAAGIEIDDEIKPTTTTTVKSVSWADHNNLPLEHVKIIDTESG